MKNVIYLFVIALFFLVGCSNKSNTEVTNLKWEQEDPRAVKFVFTLENNGDSEVEYCKVYFEAKTEEGNTFEDYVGIGRLSSGEKREVSYSLFVDFEKCISLECIKIEQ